ncbi:MAG: hypothetical protein IPP19_07040 [Verrucomicrobia bacterium]|nr:hypothetical protein [Verrucomicrobiota bacterium]
MLLRLIATAALTLSLMLAGCASHQKMANLDDTAKVSKSTKSVYLMTVTLRNTFVPSYQPKLQTVKLLKITGPDTSKVIQHEADLLSRNETNSATTGSSYLLRLEIEPGEYSILGLESFGQSMLITGSFFTPLGARLIVSKTPGVYYLGHIDATVRARKGEEFPAGGYLPRQEQRLTGASTGSFDVAISDHWETDGAKFLNKFPALKDLNVQKAVLSPYSRESIQRWWDKNTFTQRP